MSTKPHQTRYKPRGASQTKKTRKRKSDRIKSLKTRLWATFSQYIRLSHANHQGMVVTSDSGQVVDWQSTHCGHLFHNSERNKSLGGNKLWYYEKNFAPQSPEGNYFNRDNAAQKYMIYAIKKYGLEEVEHMRRLKEEYKLWTEQELEEKLSYYKSLLSKLQQRS